jgi:hypothetical protein
LNTDSSSVFPIWAPGWVGWGRHAFGAQHGDDEVYLVTDGGGRGQIEAQGTHVLNIFRSKQRCDVAHKVGRGRAVWGGADRGSIAAMVVRSIINRRNT